MNKILIAIIGLLFISNVFAQSGKTAHFSINFSLENALSYDTDELDNPQCETEETIAEVVQVYEEWIHILENPEQLQGDVELLKGVRELIEAAKLSIQSTESEFQSALGGNFVQLKKSQQIKVQKTQNIHKLYRVEMETILSQVNALNNSHAQSSELVALCDSILEKIDALILSLEDLVNNQDNFDSYLNTLYTKLSLVKQIRLDCYGPDNYVAPHQIDARVSSATLDEFTYQQLTDSDGQVVETQGTSVIAQDDNAPEGGDQQQQNTQFIAQSGTLSFSQQKQAKSHMNVQKKSKNHRK